MADITNAEIINRVQSFVDKNDGDAGDGKASLISEDKINKAFIGKYKKDVLKNIPHGELDQFHAANRELSKYIPSSKMPYFLQALDEGCHTVSNSALCGNSSRWKEAIARNKAYCRTAAETEVQRQCAEMNPRKLSAIDASHPQYRDIVFFSQFLQTHSNPTLQSLGKELKTFLDQGRVKLVDELAARNAIAVFDPRDEGYLLLSTDALKRRWSEDVAKMSDELITDYILKLDAKDREKLLIDTMQKEFKGEIKALLGQDVESMTEAQLKDLGKTIAGATDPKIGELRLKVFRKARRVIQNTSPFDGIPMAFPSLYISLAHELYHVAEHRLRERNADVALNQASWKYEYYLQGRALDIRTRQPYSLTPTGRLKGEGGLFQEMKLLDNSAAKAYFDSEEEAAEAFGRELARQFLPLWQLSWALQTMKKIIPGMKLFR